MKATVEKAAAIRIEGFMIDVLFRGSNNVNSEGEGVAKKPPNSEQDTIRISIC